MIQRSLIPGAVTSRHVTREFFALFTPVTLAFVILYLVIDFFERLDILLENQASASSTFRYFAFKIPLMVTQVLPPAVLAAMLLSLGLMSRRNEIIALRSAGVSLFQMSMPLLCSAMILSLAALAWNETVVPYCTQQYQLINTVEIRKRQLRSIFSDREIWYHGANGFYNIEFIDAKRKTLLGLTLFGSPRTTSRNRVVQVPLARWTDSGWITEGAIEYSTDATGKTLASPLPPQTPVVSETLDDFLEVRRDPAELSYTKLRERVRDLSRKGIDASNYLVDLNLKLAVPFAAVVLAWVAVPLAGRVHRNPSVAAIVATGLGVGFAYWIVLALANSLGQSGALPPGIAAWAANGIFVLVGLALFLKYE